MIKTLGYVTVSFDRFDISCTGNARLKLVDDVLVVEYEREDGSGAEVRIAGAVPLIKSEFAPTR